MILVDSNIPMYLVGSHHPHKLDAQRALERLIAARERLVTDAEVFQEILHRYVAIQRLDAIEPAFAALRSVVDEVIPVTESDVLRAKSLLLAVRTSSARDAIHLAIMERMDITRILTFDRGFDGQPGVTRIS